MEENQSGHIRVIILHTDSELHVLRLLRRIRQGHGQSEPDLTSNDIALIVSSEDREAVIELSADARLLTPVPLDHGFFGAGFEERFSPHPLPPLNKKY